MKTTASRFAALAALTLALAASCDRTPTSPSAPSRPRVTRVELVVPKALAPGASAQFRAIARSSDGTIQDITASAIFGSSQPDVLTITPGGIATAFQVGESFVSANNGTVSSGTSEVVVVPDGTYRVVGQVVEDDTPSLPVGGVRVEVDGGVPPVSTDLAGRYRLYGVPASAHMRVSKNGYTTKELTLEISDHHTENVALALSGPRIDVSGTYRLTIEASPSCRDSIPENVRTRDYSAAITQNGAALRVVLSGANFYPAPNTSRSATIDGGLDQRGIVWEFRYFGNYDNLYPDIVEIIDETTHLVIEGQVRLSPVGANFSGTLGGSFLVFERYANGVTPKADCRSSHRVSLTR
jgi:hypothetical protein